MAATANRSDNNLQTVFGVPVEKGATTDQLAAISWPIAEHIRLHLGTADMNRASNSLLHDLRTAKQSPEQELKPGGGMLWVCRLCQRRRRVQMLLPQHNQGDNRLE